MIPIATRSREPSLCPAERLRGCGLGEPPPLWRERLIWHQADGGRPEDVVRTLLEHLSDELDPQLRASVPILLIASQLSAHTVKAFVETCRTGRRPRPLASMRMETSLVLHPFAQRTGWSGPAFALATPDGAVSAVRWARACVDASRAAKVLVCEVLPAVDRPSSGNALAVGLAVGPAAVRTGHKPTWSPSPRPSGKSFDEAGHLSPRSALLAAVDDGRF